MKSPKSNQRSMTTPGDILDFSKWGKFPDNEVDDGDDRNEDSSDQQNQNPVLDYSGGRSSLLGQQHLVPVLTKFDTSRCQVTAVVVDLETSLIDPSLQSDTSSLKVVETTEKSMNVNEIESMNASALVATRTAAAAAAFAAESMTTTTSSNAVESMPWPSGFMTIKQNDYNIFLNEKIVARSFDTRTRRADYRVKSSSIPTSWMDKGGNVTFTSSSSQDKFSMLWSQDRFSVTMRVLVPKNIQVVAVKVRGILPFTERYYNSATARNNHHPPTLIVLQTQKRVWWQGDLPHPVHLEEGDDDDDGDGDGDYFDDDGCDHHGRYDTAPVLEKQQQQLQKHCAYIDWDIQSPSGDKRRFLTITLNKAVPVPELSVWWKRPLLKCLERNNDDGVQRVRSLLPEHSWHFNDPDEAHDPFQHNCLH